MSNSNAFTNKTVLVILSGSNRINLQKKSKPTGFFLSELMIPVQLMRSNGINLIYANPTGLPPPMDPFSNHRIWFGFSKKKLQQARTALEKEMTGGMKSPIKFTDLTEEKLATIDGVFIPGGHAPLTDLWNDANLGRILTYFHESNKPIGAICHGPAGLLSTKLLNQGHFPFEGYRITCYSSIEEKSNELMWFDKLKWYQDCALREIGAIVRNKKIPMFPNVVLDRELVTGQGPTSANKFARTFVNHLFKYNPHSY